MILLFHNNSYIQNYPNELSSEQKNTYNNVLKERLKIAIYGFIIGLILSLILILILRLDAKNNKFLDSNQVCLFVNLTFVIQIIWYLFSPKDYNMEGVLDETFERQDWDKYIKNITNNIIISLYITFISFIIIYVFFEPKINEKN